MKKYSSAIVLLITISIPAMFNSCAAEHGESSFNSTGAGLAACMPILSAAYQPYHQVLKNKCSACHFSGGTGNGAFADNNISVALGVFHKAPESGFNGKGETLVYQYAVDGSHNPPNTGPANAALLDPLRTPWNDAVEEFDTCMVSAGSPDGGGGGSEIPPPTIFTINKTINPNNNVQNIEFDLGSEMAGGGALAGARFIISYRQGQTTTNIPALYISNPRLVAGAAGAEVKAIGIRLNGTLVTGSPGTTWTQVNRLVPINRTRYFNNSGGGEMQVEGSNFTSIGIGFGSIAAAPNVGGQPFNPPTYQQLMANGGLFQARCVTCHANNNSALVFPNAQNNAAWSLFKLNYAQPYSPQTSAVYLRTQDNSMPQGGPALTPAEKAQIEQWLVDGALLNEPAGG